MGVNANPITAESGVSMQFVIKNPAPPGDDSYRWGDEYFGRALENSLTEAGCTVRQDFWGEWDQGPEEAVVLVLRGKRSWLPPKGGYRILWIISHPSEVTREELDHYDLILSASRVHAPLLASCTKTPVRAALQCTDEQNFHPPETLLDHQAHERAGVVYAANSRGVQRDMGRWLLATGRKARVFGQDWRSRGLGHLVEALHLPNDRVAQIYRESRLVLNDHWLDMRGLGYINNRLFDCVASGTPVLTDESPEVRAIFGDALLYANSAKTFEETMRTYEQDYSAILQRVDEARRRLIPDFTFRARARELIAWVERKPDSRKPSLNRSDLPLDTRLEHLLRANLGQCEQASREQAERIEKAEKEAAEQAEQLEKAEQAAAEMARQLKNAEEVLRYCDRLEHDLNQILSSRSWRLTALLRRAADALRSLRFRRRRRRRRVLERPPEIEQLRETLRKERG